MLFVRSVALAFLLIVPMAWQVLAEVHETVLGPANAGGSYVVSPEGAHVAYVGMKGTRLSVAVNGVEGPIFDELYTPDGRSYFCPQQAGAWNANQGSDVPVIFSTDGEHYAYAGRQGEEYVIIYDGKEIGRGPRTTLALNYGPLTMTPKGRQVYWAEMQHNPSRSSWRLVMTGKPGPWSGNQTMKPVFSPDESRYAYTAVRTDDPNAPAMFIVDGKDAGYSAYQPVFTADNSMLLAISPASASNPKPALLVNGKPVVSEIGVGKIVASPVGNRYAAFIQTGTQNYNSVFTLYIDGKPVPGAESAQEVWFSKDGKHYAAACTNISARSMFMVVDGKKHREYQGMSTEKVYWTPDGSKFIYTVTSGGRSFLVVNEQEFPINALMGHEPIIMPPVGNRVAFGTRDGSNRNFSLMLDGKEVLAADVSPVDNTITFSPDGSRFAYLYGPVGRNEITGIVLDGEAKTDIVPGYFRLWKSSLVQNKGIEFSPDGKHYIISGTKTDTKEYGTYIDGKLFYAASRGVFNPTFTPDSRHLLWFADEKAAVAGQQSPTVVYADGVEQLRVNGWFFRETNSWVMDDAGVVTFLAADGNQVKRYRITAPASENIDQMAALFAEKRAKMEAEAKSAAQKVAQEAEAAKAKVLAEKQAAADKYKADYEAAVAKRKADYEAALEARKKAYTEAANAKKLHIINAQRARQKLPPLKELP